MAKVNYEQCVRVAEIIRTAIDAPQGLDFYHIKTKGELTPAPHMFPELWHHRAVDFFFFSCMQNYGFWYGNDHGYEAPLFATINGMKMKGSDALTIMCKKALDKNEDIFHPHMCARMTPDEFAGILSDDHGPVPFPDFEARFRLARAFGAWFIKNRTLPEDLVRQANASGQPLRFLIETTAKIPGYNADYLNKKNYLLAMALAQRPEHFLKVSDPEHWQPIVDYHLMRVALRLGIVDIWPEESLLVANRAWIGSAAEDKIRFATYTANQMIVEQSGKPMFVSDNTFWHARKYCPEMATPQCEKCIFNAVCEKRVELFQPVIRTTNY